MIDENFYRAFEDRHRGTRETIKSRLSVYLPFIRPLLAFYSDRRVADLGCGRGEWLELMSEAGFEAHGVDLDEGMLEACRVRGLSASKEDAFTYLRSLSDESLAIVSGFHIAEHLSAEYLHNLVRESVRVLKPGGLLIMETPNPENLIVGASNFYMDPTHKRPIPPRSLSFLMEFYGFARVKILRLQESSELTDREKVQIIDVIAGVSPDYAVVAQKSDIAEHMSLFDSAFSREYGLTLEVLASRYERRISDLEREHLEVYNSRSWRITAPLRAAFDLLQRAQRKISPDVGTSPELRWSITNKITPTLSSVPQKTMRLIKDLASPLFVALIHFALDHPELKAKALAVLSRYPGLTAKLYRFAAAKGIIAGGSIAYMSSRQPLEPLGLTVSSQAIYADLKEAIELHRSSS